MTKEDFEKRMGAAVLYIEEGIVRHSCNAVCTAFYMQKDKGTKSEKLITKSKIKNQFIKSISYLLEEDSLYIDWYKLGIGDSQSKNRKEFRVKLLEDFEKQCLEDKFYREL